MNQDAVTQRAGLSPLSKWGLGLALAALLLPVAGVIAFVLGITALVRNEVGPGIAIVVLSSLCTMVGFGLALGLAGY